MIVDRDVLKARIGFREDVELLQAVFLEELFCLVVAQFSGRFRKWRNGEIREGRRESVS
jgi:hypothetical protein